ncbi:MAG: hypothetical protein ABFE07_12315 [Armatimonadia bacterium]
MTFNPQPLEFKQNFDDALRRMEAFWSGEIIDRPACGITAPLLGKQPLPGTVYMEGAREDFAPIIDRALHNASCTWYGGEAMPFYTPSFGPDQWAAWMGADLQWASDEEQSRTSWVVPFVENWEDAFPLHIDTEGKWWRRMLDFVTALGEAMQGKMLVSHLDLHSNADALSAIRTPARLCMDFYDYPYLIDKAMRQVRGLFPFVYESLFQAGRMSTSGTQGWVPLYHPGRTNTLQCDFLALIGPEQSRRYVIPALDEEASYLDSCSYHFDGPECLVHLDDILAVEGIQVIQWVCGARNKPNIEWLDLFKRIQAAGKGLWLATNPEELKIYMKELRPEGMYYQMSVSTPEEGQRVLDWMSANT